MRPSILKRHHGCSGNRVTFAHVNSPRDMGDVVRHEHVLMVETVAKFVDIRTDVPCNGAMFKRRSLDDDSSDDDWERPYAEYQGNKCHPSATVSRPFVQQYHVPCNGAMVNRMSLDIDSSDEDTPPYIGYYEKMARRLDAAVHRS
jgi:hypothetical protein